VCVCVCVCACVCVCVCVWACVCVCECVFMFCVCVCVCGCVQICMSHVTCETGVHTYVICIYTMFWCVVIRIYILYLYMYDNRRAFRSHVSTSSSGSIYVYILYYYVLYVYIYCIYICMITGVHLDPMSPRHPRDPYMLYVYIL